MRLHDCPWSSLALEGWRTVAGTWSRHTLCLQHCYAVMRRCLQAPANEPHSPLQSPAQPGPAPHHRRAVALDERGPVGRRRWAGVQRAARRRVPCKGEGALRVLGSTHSFLGRQLGSDSLLRLCCLCSILPPSCDPNWAGAPHPHLNPQQQPTGPHQRAAAPPPPPAPAGPGEGQRGVEPVVPVGGAGARAHAGRLGPRRRVPQAAAAARAAARPHHQRAAGAGHGSHRALGPGCRFRDDDAPEAP
jgi:hypothetical protein